MLILICFVIFSVLFFFFHAYILSIEHSKMEQLSSSMIERGLN